MRTLILTHSNTFPQLLTVIWLKFLNIDDILKILLRAFLLFIVTDSLKLKKILANFSEWLKQILDG